MNLFDYIKYSNTDLSDLEQVKALPKDLLRKFWFELTGSISKDSIETIHTTIVRWNSNPAYSPNKLQADFLMILKEYCDEPV